MIVNSEGMKQIEASSGASVDVLMERAGSALAEALQKEITAGERILILAGCGNNGGDGYVICRYLKDYNCRIIPVDGLPKTDAALKNMKLLDAAAILKPSAVFRQIEQADVIIDALYGFGFRGELHNDMRKVFKAVNSSNARVYSVDINSGSEADTDHHDIAAVRSDITFALDCYKPCHMLRKETGLFREVRLLPLDLPHPEVSPYCEMSEDEFFRSFPRRSENAYKGTYGKTLLIGGSYGMAGAVSLNITGARTVGAPYVEVCLPEEIYPIVAAKHTTAVFHPFRMHEADRMIEPYSRKAKAIAFGSGAVALERKEQCMDMILQSSTVPVILDAEALRLLHHNTYILRFVKCPVILTPHLGEFAAMLNLPAEVIQDNKMLYASRFAQENGVYLVLKGPNTIAASPNGEIYINQSGNPALAQAGSGDVLTGIMAGILTLTADVFKAVCMSVWLHGYLADLGTKTHSMQGFCLESFPAIADELFRRHGF